MRQKIKVYTKTGDKGHSSLYNGERRPKYNSTFEALGTADELNSFIGLARVHCTNEPLSTHLPRIQSLLLDLGAHVATPRAESDDKRLAKTTFSDAPTAELEQWIDGLDEHLPPLRTFVLPSGGVSSAHLHVCRSVTRRLERRLVPLMDDGEIDAAALRYVNRLSDYFFVAARFACQEAGEQETAYKPGAAQD